MPGLFNFATDADAEKARSYARRYAEQKRDEAVAERRAYAVALELAAFKRRVRELNAEVPQANREILNLKGMI